MIRASWVRYLVLLSGLALVMTVLVTAMWPWPYYAAVERFFMPEYESRFGFRWGQIEVRVGDETQRVDALVTVVPGGRMSQAGAVAGDIPVAYHGGLGALCGAVRWADRGKEAEFEVVSAKDWPDRSKRRKITLRATPAGRVDRPSH